jgi:hypothetical protein
MRRFVGGALVLLLALPALRADDPPKDKASEKPATPAEQYQALLKEAQEAQQEFMKSVRAAKTPEERSKVMQEQNPKKALAPKFLEFAEKNSNEPVALDALIWIVADRSGPPGSNEPRDKAIAILLRDHVESEKLAAVCQTMGFDMGKQNAAFLRAVLEKNKSPEVRAEAALALAQSMVQRGMIVKRMKDDAAIAKQVESMFGKEQADELKKADLAQINAEADQLFRELGEKHVANMKPERLAMLMQQLRFAENKGVESLLRTLVEKDTRPEVQGPACLTLAQLLKGRADESATTDAKSADKLREEAEKLFEQAADKFADVKMGFRGTVGSVAKRELFDLRNLSVGKPAPDVEGEDQDGQKFKLSDYKGKVVLLDFWSEF